VLDKAVGHSDDGLFGRDVLDAKELARLLVGHRSILLRSSLGRLRAYCETFRSELCMQTVRGVDIVCPLCVGYEAVARSIRASD
jgi:hypothetical protein